MFKKYLCVVCGHIYDEEMGDVDSGILPGTLWEDIPLNWFCPECNAIKSDFTLLTF